MTITEARDELFAMLKAAWDLSAGLAIGGDTPLVLWQGQENEPRPPADQPYARATVLHSDRNQASLAGADSLRRYDNTGVVIVQCFGPLTGGKGMTTAEALALIAKNAYEGKSSPGGIWFRRCRTNEIGPSDGWYQINAVAEFTYDEVR